jgi:hypothetical protein
MEWKMNTIELTNIEITEYCLLDRQTGDKQFYQQSKVKGFTGLYFRDENTFFAIYPTASGPKIYYCGKEHTLTPELDITLQKDGEKREFAIRDFGIEIEYHESPYIGFDVWSAEIDVDLFFMIEQRYKEPSFYERYTASGGGD